MSWIMLTGPLGCGKSKVAEVLKKELEIVHATPTEAGSFFEGELSWLLARQQAQLSFQARVDTANLLTLRSIWDSGEVFARAALELEMISLSQYNIIKMAYYAIHRTMVPPHAVIYMRPSVKMTSFDRVLLRDGFYDENYMEAISRAYEDFIARLAVPVIEVDASQPFDIIKADVEFGVASLRSTELTSQTIWKRTMFRDEALK